MGSKTFNMGQIELVVFTRQNGLLLLAESKK